MLAYSIGGSEALFWLIVIVAILVGLAAAKYVLCR